MRSVVFCDVIGDQHREKISVIGAQHQEAISTLNTGQQ